MSSTATLKCSAIIQFIRDTTGPGQSNPPLSSKLETNVKSRIENQVSTIASNSTLDVVATDEGMSATSLVRIACLTVGKKFTLYFNGGLTGIEVLPPSATDYAFFLATVNLSSFSVENPTSNTTEIDIEYSIAQYQAP